jgi:hypothetical protein
MVKKNKAQEALLVSLKDKDNLRLSCKRNNCTGTTFIHLGSSFKCLKCGNIYQVADLQFIGWEICGRLKISTEK